MHTVMLTYYSSDVGEAVFTRPRQYWRGRGEAAENQADRGEVEAEAEAEVEARQSENHVNVLN